ncbi:hypothetical protein BV898_02826 [Hypsibius exemplaris]|uniref:Uncharacterized protein n=1 Tax=Hypsibius exemplaris TaxID=2072580 RepID=A0A1W0X7M3_HYPEX|nr:hypothetical protein BV898_02826 [Hypsibius exemplaris]
MALTSKAWSAGAIQGVPRGRVSFNVVTSRNQDPLWLCRGKDNLCISETYDGQCEDDDNPACSQSCKDESRSGGKCERLRNIKVCYCDGCPGTTVVTRRPSITPGGSTMNPLLEQVLRRSATQPKPNFTLSAISAEDCAALNTDNCFLVRHFDRQRGLSSDKCDPDRGLFTSCNSSAGEIETKYFLLKSVLMHLLPNSLANPTDRCFAARARMISAGAISNSHNNLLQYFFRESNSFSSDVRSARLTHNGASAVPIFMEIDRSTAPEIPSRAAMLAIASSGSTREFAVSAEPNMSSPSRMLRLRSRSAAKLQ